MIQAAWGDVRSLLGVRPPFFVYLSELDERCSMQKLIQDFIDFQLDLTSYTLWLATFTAVGAMVVWGLANIAYLVADRAWEAWEKQRGKRE